MKPILLDIPEQFETERLLLRAPLFGDGVIINEAIRESFKTLNEWLNWADHIPEIEETEANVRKNRANFLLREGFIFYMLEKASGVFIGTCGLVRIDWNVRKFEIGYWIRNSASGHGYMTEAVNGLTEYAFNYFDANRIEILCDTKNTASRMVAERCGFHLEAILKKNFINPFGELRDDCIYAKVRLEDRMYGYPNT
ncbi:GNAT family N-acetyltransferase [Cohnella abietis]|uniref:Ribosomal-protein-serine acetyltransferase n=1 Tax=Cohnella abietis TaxID=2507935 RepID=A0A3T1D727_9BACL|nr:GNAT family N-acetyltransferase [Cohnella abietis]BBI33849.1 ribosomal-protein-serine acetyltransferase [Cohnella abietis]